VVVGARKTSGGMLDEFLGQLKQFATWVHGAHGGEPLLHWKYYCLVNYHLLLLYLLPVIS
jgi:hypothetical protein